MIERINVIIIKILRRCEMKALLLIIVVLLFSTNIFGQEMEDKMFDVGIGLGACYGGLGANFDYCLLPNLNIFVGFGFIKSELPLSFDESQSKYIWAIGTRYHFLSADNVFRPRVSVYYGENSFFEHLKKAENGHIIGKFITVGNGLSLGGGFKLMFGSSKSFGIDVDIYYAIIADSPLSKAKFVKYYPIVENDLYYYSVGARYAFDL